MGAAADCELITHALFGQPVNSLTTFAFVVAGVFVSRHTALRWVGLAMIATGVGSFLFHGPMIRGTEWAHDVTLAWLILVSAGLGSSVERWTRLPGLGLIAGVFALVPGWADPIAVALAVVAVVVIVQADHSMANLTLFGSLGVFALLGRLGATGGPLCSPTSLWQWHGLWHIGAAGVVALWSLRWSRREVGLYTS